MKKKHTPHGEMEYYFKDKKEQIKGPVALDALIFKKRLRDITSKTLVCQYATDKWIKFSKIPESHFSKEELTEVDRLHNVDFIGNLVAGACIALAVFFFTVGVGFLFGS